MWLGSDSYETASLCAKKVYEQLNSLKTILHPITGKKLEVLRRTVADGKTRRSSCGSSSACSAYPIPEAPEHIQQLGDMSLLFEEPVWTVEETNKYQELFPVWLQDKKDTPANRRQFAKEHFGNKGNENLTGTDLRYFYPPVMHRAIRAAETIGRRIGVVAEQKYKKKKEWYEQMAKVAKKSSSQEQKIALSEDGVIAFFKNCPSFLQESKFNGLTLDILVTFGDGLRSLFEMLLNTPVGLTGEEFHLQARILLGFQYIHIFGTKTVTATIKQIAAYTGFYIEQARQDGELVGLPISLQNFSDGLMETAHKDTKFGTMRFSNGRTGPTTEEQYQKLILSQQIMNNIMQMKNRESIPTTSSSAKIKRKLKSEENSQKGKRPRLGVSVTRNRQIHLTVNTVF